MNYIRIPILLFSIVFFSCQNSKEEFKATAIADYLPMQIGKYITYRIDSTVFTQNGAKIELHKYQVKHTVISETTDNLGRKTFIINRFMRNETGTSAWTGNGSYLVTPFDDRIEIVENNLRTVPFHLPIKQGFTWKGNSYLPYAPYKPLFSMEGAGNDMNKWDFVYRSFGDTTVQNQSYKDVWTIVQSENIQNIPPVSVSSFGVIEVSTEKYAKDIGLVYKNFQLYEHQPPHADNTSEAYYGFGITMWMIDHN